MRGVILSRTMLGRDICFSIHDFNTGLQYRPVSKKNNKFNLKDPMSLKLFESIWPKTIIEYDVLSNESQRITHPEDVTISQEIKPIGEISNQEYLEIIKQHFHSSIKDFQPSLQVSHKKAYIDEIVQTQHSIGYIHAKRIAVYKESNFNKMGVRVFILDDNDMKLQAPLKDCWQHKFYMDNLQDEEQITYDDVILRLSLAAPFNPSLSWLYARCYLQVSMIEFL